MAKTGDFELLLRRYKRGCEEGHESAFWDAILLCERSGERKPEWLRERLERYAKDRVNGRHPFSNKSGAKQNLLRDAHIFVCAEGLRKELVPFGRKRKLRHRSLPKALRIVQQELARQIVEDREFALRDVQDQLTRQGAQDKEFALQIVKDRESTKANRSLGGKGMRKAYANGKRIMSDPESYRGSVHSEEIEYLYLFHRMYLRYAKST